MLSCSSLIAPGRFPSRLHQIIVGESDDVWTDTMERIQSHPNEITVTGMYGQTALHAACLQYPPTHVIRAMLDKAPSCAQVQNLNGETALHIATTCASEHVQQLLIEASPDAVQMVDKYGDTPLHMAARSGATYNLLEIMCRASPETIALANKNRKTPFWLLSRLYLEATSLEEVELEGGEFESDWQCSMLFLRVSYNHFLRNHGIIQEDEMEFSLAHAVACTPVCPRDLVSFVCKMCPPGRALQYNAQGQTPLLLAASAPVVEEPSEWDEHEDGYRETVDATESGGYNENDDNNDSDDHAAHVALQNFANSNANLERTVEESTSNANHNDQPHNNTSHNDASCSVLNILLEWNPRAARMADSNGRLPLTMALLSNKTWRGGIRQVLWAAPRVLETRDVLTHMYPFQLAALHCSDLATVFLLLRSLPELVALGLVNASEMPETQDDTVSVVDKCASHKQMDRGDPQYLSCNRKSESPLNSTKCENATASCVCHKGMDMGGQHDLPSTRKSESPANVAKRPRIASPTTEKSKQQ